MTGWPFWTLYVLSGANKLTGFLLFLAVPTVFRTLIPVAVVAAVATFAAIQEGHFIRMKKGLGLTL